jgi:hypothetical protein
VRNAFGIGDSDLVRIDRPNQHDRFAQAAEDLLSDFESWASDHNVDVDLFVVEAALDWRGEGDGDLARWGVEDMRELMVAWFPRKVTMPQSEWPAVLSTLHHWVDFLSGAQADRLDDPASLHAEIDRSTEAFFASMSDERNYGLAKFWTTRMIEHGVDPEDGDQVRGFLAAAQAGEIDYDQDVLAEIMQRGAFDGELGDFEPGDDEDDERPLPPVMLPPEPELAALARDSILVARLRVLVNWLGAGRTLTTTKRLRVADARELAGLLAVDQPYLARARSSADLPEVTLLVAWARAARLARVVKGRLVPVKSAAGLMDRPLDLWRRAHAAFGELGPAVCPPASHYEGPSLLGQILPEVAPELWLTLYIAGGTPVPVELLVEIVRETMADCFTFGVSALMVELRDLMWRRDLARVLAALETLGAVELTVATDSRERDKIVELSGNDDPDLTLVRLTPLGLWGVREVLMEDGFDAPLARDLAGKPVDEVCEALEHAAPELAESVLTAWVAARTPAAAAAELAAFCSDASSPSARLLAWAALEHTGPAGVEQARRLRSAGGVAGAMATEWLVRHSDLDERAVQEEEMLLALAENLAAMHDHDVLIEELIQHPVDDQIGFVRALAATDHPDRSELLAVISAQHPVQQVAAMARTAIGTRGGRLLRSVAGTRPDRH